MQCAAEGHFFVPQRPQALHAVMIITAEQLPTLFNAVNQDKHLSEDKSILVLVANGDVDSLCTCALLEVSMAIIWHPCTSLAMCMACMTSQHAYHNNSCTCHLHLLSLRRTF